MFKFMNKIKYPIHNYKPKVISNVECPQIIQWTSWLVDNTMYVCEQATVRSCQTAKQRDASQSV